MTLDTTTACPITLTTLFPLKRYDDADLMSKTSAHMVYRVNGDIVVRSPSISHRGRKWDTTLSVARLIVRYDGEIASVWIVGTSFLRSCVTGVAPTYEDVSMHNTAFVCEWRTSRGKFESAVRWLLDNSRAAFIRTDLGLETFDSDRLSRNCGSIILSLDCVIGSLTRMWASWCRVYSNECYRSTVRNLSDLFKGGLLFQSGSSLIPSLFRELLGCLSIPSDRK